MALKALFISLITALITVGCVAFPEDHYNPRTYEYRSNGGYAYPSKHRYDERYDRRYDRRYDDRQRWEQERAYRLQQARKEQERRQYLIKKQHWEDQQAKRDQTRNQQFDHPKRTWDKKTDSNSRWNNNANQKQWQQHQRPEQHREKKRDDRKNRENDRD